MRGREPQRLRVAGVLLAAGGASRMGTPKQLLEYRGASLVRRAARALVGSRCDPVIAVVGARRAEVAAALESLPIVLVPHPGWADGMASSIRVGIEAAAAVRPPVQGALLATADQPHLSAALLDRLVEAFGPDAARCVASEYAGAAGTPALFPRARFPELRALAGDRGARDLLRREAGLRRVPFPGGEVDVDTPDDYARLVAPGAPEKNGGPDGRA